MSMRLRLRSREVGSPRALVSRQLVSASGKPAPGLEAMASNVAHGHQFMGLLLRQAFPFQHPRAQVVATKVP
jgi:hypothetical protein